MVQKMFWVTIIVVVGLLTIAWVIETDKTVTAKAKLNPEMYVECFENNPHIRALQDSMSQDGLTEGEAQKLAKVRAEYYIGCINEKRGVE